MPQTQISVSPFGFEAKHPQNCDLLLQAIPNMRLRSSIEGPARVQDAKTGDWVVPHDQAVHMASYPRTPGMQIFVNPGELTYEVTDPLTEDEDLLNRLTRWMNNNTGHRTPTTIRGVPKKSGTLDVHRMKTLCRELFNIVQAGQGKFIKGPPPTMAEIAELPGEFLLNPGSRVGNTQPVYEKDWDDWVANLSRMGG